MSRRRRDDEDLGDEEDEEESHDGGDRASKKPAVSNKSKRRKVSSFIDDAAEESGEEEGGDDDEEEDEDDDNNDYIKDGFVVDDVHDEAKVKKDDLEDSEDEDDDDDDDDDADDEDGVRRAKRAKALSKRLTKVRKMKDTDRLDDEDLALIQEAQQLDGPERAAEQEQQAPPKSVVAKTAEELRKGLFDDEDEVAARPPGTKERQQVRVERYDEDGMDDFIDDDIGDQGEILASERRGRYDEEDEVNEAQLNEASEIFGTDYLDFMEGDQEEEEELMGKSAWKERGVGVDLGVDSDEEILSEDEDLFGEDEDEDEIDSEQKAEALRLKREKRKLAKAERRRQSLVKKAERRKAQLRRVFEPVQLVENFCTERDDEIRQKDVPERLFDIDTPFYGSPEDGLSELEEAQTRWIASRIYDIQSELSSVSMEYERRKILESIAVTLRFVHRDKLEPSFIRMYRRDYVTSPSVLANLYSVLEEDGEWHRLTTARDKVGALLDELSKSSGGPEGKSVDSQMLETIQRELHDARSKLDETSKQESIVKADLEALGKVGEDEDDDELFGDEGDKDEVSF
jgi:hypothetical protein